jgi:hypothetical protein
MWTMTQNEDGTWTLTRDGEPIGEPFASAAEAAAAIPEDGLTGEAGPEFQAILCVEGVPTGESPKHSRYLEVGGGAWRALPLPFMAMQHTPPEGGHAGAVLAGRIDRIERLSDGRRIWAQGHFDTGDVGTEVARLVHDQTLRHVSIDPTGVDEVLQPLSVSAEDGFPTRMLARFQEYTIGMATVVPFPAIAQAVVWLSGDPIPAEVSAELPDPIPADQAPAVDGPAEGDILGEIAILASGGTREDVVAAEPVRLYVGALVASAATAPARPPRAWFEDPALGTPTRLTVLDDGRVFGHIAEWNCCHTGYVDRCVQAPKNPTGDYPYFLTGETLCDDGSRIMSGALTVGGDHAETNLGLSGAQRHYSDVTMAWADVNVGEDAHGIWVAGALRPSVTEDQLRVVRGSAPSGDWRPTKRGLELIAAHSVNHPGFPVSARVRDGQVLSLVASAGPHLVRDPIMASAAEARASWDVSSEDVAAGLMERLRVVELAIQPLLPMAREVLAAEIGEPEPEAAPPSPLEVWAAGRGWLSTNATIIAGGTATIALTASDTVLLADAGYVECPTCGGSGDIRDGNMTCPDCNGKGEVTKAKAASMAGVTVDVFAVTKSEGDAGNFPASDYAYVPDPAKPSTWKLRLTKTPGGTPDAGIVGAAIAALGKGFRGQKVDIPAAALAGVKAKVAAAWKKANPDKDPDDMPKFEDEGPTPLERLLTPVGV